MYVPPPYQMADLVEQQAFVEEFGFGTLSTSSLEACHLPLLLDKTKGEFGALVGHMARVNPLWRDLEGQEVLVVFQGPHSYISPTWYQTQPSVGTWSYAAVHAKGVVQLLDEEATLAQVQALTEKYDAGVSRNTDIMAPNYVQRLLKAIVGFRVTITSLQGQKKLGLNKKEADVQGVKQGLRDSANLASLQLLEYMERQ